MLESSLSYSINVMFCQAVYFTLTVQSAEPRIQAVETPAKTQWVISKQEDEANKSSTAAQQHITTQLSNEITKYTEPVNSDVFVSQWADFSS